jgi:hypothetical protein
MTGTQIKLNISTPNEKKVDESLILPLTSGTPPEVKDVPAFDPKTNLDTKHSVPSVQARPEDTVLLPSILRDIKPEPPMKIEVKVPEVKVPQEDRSSTAESKTRHPSPKPKTQSPRPVKTRCPYITRKGTQCVQEHLRKHGSDYCKKHMELVARKKADEANPAPKSAKTKTSAAERSSPKPEEPKVILPPMPVIIGPPDDPEGQDSKPKDDKDVEVIQLPKFNGLALPTPQVKAAPTESDSGRVGATIRQQGEDGEAQPQEEPQGEAEPEEYEMDEEEAKLEAEIELLYVKEPLASVLKRKLPLSGRTNQSAGEWLRMCQHVEDEHNADMVMRIGVLTMAKMTEKFIDWKKPGFNINGFTDRLDNEETEYCVSAMRKKYLAQLTLWLGPEARMIANVANTLVSSLKIGETDIPLISIMKRPAAPSLAGQPKPGPIPPPFNG